MKVRSISRSASLFTKTPRKNASPTAAPFLCYCAAEKYAGGDHAVDGATGTEKVRRIVRCSCRDGKPSNPDVKPAIRFRVPAGKTVFSDAVFGDREFDNDEIEDFVLLRSGKDGEEWGMPTYQMSVVVDDIDMRITHVIRGADHISNTPETGFALSRHESRAADLRAPPADSRCRQIAPLQTPRRHRRQHVPRRRLPPRGIPQFPRASRLGPRRRRRISPHQPS